MLLTVCHSQGIEMQEAPARKWTFDSFQFCEFAVWPACVTAADSRALPWALQSHIQP